MGIGPILNVVSGLDLHISGSLGSFSVRPAAPEVPSIPVKYLQTHVTFDLDGGQRERLFQNLLPVREIFEAKDMNFDDLMQRDIDDGRVSTELIPYLLEPGAAVKFFPPIIAVVVPVGPQKELLTSYPEIAEETIASGAYNRRVQRAGAYGKEVFEFEQIEVNGELLAFDNARLRLNSNRCKIVIVDGQHRAMALLALYRNLKGWPDNTAAYRHYYARWSRELINKFDLKQISLPMAICVFPTLSGENPPLRVTEACRSVFLALNKNARPVTRARNILLNDKDIIAHFERAILGEVKNYHIDAPSRLRLWNFELDAERDRSVLTSPVALSGVMHLHHLLERVLMLGQKPTGLNVPASNLWLRKNISDTVLRRLDADNLLGSDVVNATTRHLFTAETRDTLLKSFEARYLRYIIKGFQKFAPYAAFASAASDVEVHLRSQTDKRTHSMLFEGQGVLRVFRQYVETLTTEQKEQEELKKQQQASELDAILTELKNLEENVTKHENIFRETRTQKLLAHLSSSKWPHLGTHIDSLYKEHLTTAAFQIALFATFFFMMEDLHGKESGDLRSSGDQQEMQLFDEYMACLNQFFDPQSDAEAKRLISTFVGSVSGQFGTVGMTVSSSETTLRNIVVHSELKPDEWPRFRYILLELWKPSHEALAAMLDEYRKQCRKDVLQAYYRQKIKIFCRSKGIDETHVSPRDDQRLRKEALTQYASALAEMVGKIPEEEHAALKNSLEKAPPTEEEISPETTSDEEEG